MRMSSIMRRPANWLMRGVDDSMGLCLLSGCEAMPVPQHYPDQVSQHLPPLFASFLTASRFSPCRQPSGGFPGCQLAQPAVPAGQNS